MVIYYSSNRKLIQRATSFRLNQEGKDLELDETNEGKYLFQLQVADMQRQWDQAECLLPASFWDLVKRIDSFCIIISQSTVYYLIGSSKAVEAI